MTSKHLVDPELAAMLDLMPSFTLTHEALPAIRVGLLEAMAQQPPADDTVEMTERLIDGPAGAPPLRVFIYRPAAQLGILPAMVHLHGGGHIMGAPVISDVRNRLLAAGANCVIVTVQYRLSPEQPFPAALEDAYAALKWLHGSGPALNIDPKRLAVGGDSAGGGLAAALAQLAHDKGEVPLVLQLLTYPMLDNRTGRTLNRGPHSGEFVWTPESNRFGWNALLGSDHPVDDVRPYAVPGRREFLAGLPPAFIAVGALDLFAEENIEYAGRLVHAGVPAELHVYPGAFHGFDALPGWMTESFIQHQVAALLRALHPRG